MVITGASDVYQILEVHEYLLAILNTYKRVATDDEPPRQRRRRGRQNRQVAQVAL